MSKLVVIYVPGLGDGNPRGQRRLVSSWRLHGVKPVFCQMNWGDDQPFAIKFQKLLHLIDDQVERGSQVALVGVSAGAGAVINAFAARRDKVVGVVLICGKVNHPEAIDPHHNQANPAFVESAKLVQSSLDQLDFDVDRPRILSRYAWFDPLVQQADSEVVGAHNQSLASFGHRLTIAHELSIGAPHWLKFLKTLAK